MQKRGKFFWAKVIAGVRQIDQRRIMGENWGEIREMKQGQVSPYKGDLKK